jgi:DNA repair protein RadC
MVALYRSHDNLPMPAPSDFPDNILHISIDDLAVNKEIVQAGKLLDVDVMDHLILGVGRTWVSLKERGVEF